MPRASEASKAALAILLWATQAAAEGFVDWTALPDVVHAEGPAVVRVPTAALILSGLPGGALGVAALATPLPVGGPKARVSVVTAIDALPDGTGGVDLFVYVLGEGGDVAASVTQRLTFDAGRLRGKRGIKAIAGVDLAPGSYRLRVLASLPAGGAFGLADHPLEVPAPNGGEPALLVPWLLEPVDPWLVALPPPGTAETPLRPLAGASGPLLPAARPALGAGDTLSVCLLARRPGSPPWKLTARFSDRAGLGAEAPFELEDRRLAPWPDLELLLVSARVPDLPAGEVSLRAAIERPDARTVLSPPLPVVMAPAGAPRVAAAAGSAAPAGGDSVGSGRRSGRRVLSEDRVSERYRRALATLAAGEAAAASALLLELEASADKVAPGAVFKELEDIQWRLLTELAAEPAETSWRALLPVVLLHADLAAEYRRRGSATLAEHAVRFGRRLGGAIARHVESSEERGEASRMLAELAGGLLAAGRLGECAELFELALALDARNAGARLGLAVSHERRGRYEAAAATLERLLEGDPAHAEARLRLGVSLARLGRTDRARTILGSLATAEAPRWIGVVAAQESARVAVCRDRLDQALEILETALGRWPEEPGLLLQRAQVLDLSDRATLARTQIARLVASPAAAEVAPRDRYNRWPADALAASRRELEADAARRLADLGRALSAGAP